MTLKSFTLGLAFAALPAVALAAPKAPEPTQLWQDIQALSKAGSLLEGSTAYQPGSRTVDVYTIDLANATANAAVRQAGGILTTSHYPNGSLLVKENYDAARKLTGVTAMLKLDGYDAAGHDWVMAAYDPKGKVMAFGPVQACIGCHAMVPKQDTVFAPPPAQLLPKAIWSAFFPTQKMSPTYLKLLDQHADAIVK